MIQTCWADLKLTDQSHGKTCLHTGGWRFSFPFVVFLLVLASSEEVLGQGASAARLIVTPSTFNLLPNETASFSANGAAGLPVTNAKWSLEPQIAELHVENGVVRVTPKGLGRAILTATAENESATAIIEIFSGEHLPDSMLRWTVDPTPGYESMLLRQAVPNQGAMPELYSIEWSKSANALVRAFSRDGQQRWAITLDAQANPNFLKPEMHMNGGILTLRGQPVTGVIQPSTNTMEFNPAVGPAILSRPGIPPDGKFFLARSTGDDNGGLLILERGRFHDFVVDLNGANGSELWRYRSAGHLAKNWTVNQSGDVAIVEYVQQPVSSALIVLNGTTGEVRFRIPFPTSSTAILNFKCVEGNDLVNLRASPAGSVFTSSDGNMYVQVEVYNESAGPPKCKPARWFSDNLLSLLRVTPEGEAEWKSFQHFHADGGGGFRVQPRLFAGETIPDGLGGQLAAWTYFYPGSKEGAKAYFEGRLTRLGPSGQQDYSMPFPFWDAVPSELFDENMVLGEDNTLYATNKQVLINFHIPAGELKWVRQPPTGDITLYWATRGGGVLVSNRGRLTLFDPEGRGAEFKESPNTTAGSGVGLEVLDPLDSTAREVLQLRDLQLSWVENFLAVEAGAPYGRGRVMEIARH